ncbi:MAG: hypothetical protein WCG25_02980 [bacterium]
MSSIKDFTYKVISAHSNIPKNNIHGYTHTKFLAAPTKKKTATGVATF